VSAVADPFVEDLERRFSEAIASGSVEGDVFHTPSGATMAMLLPQYDDHEVIADRCVWCDGHGYGGDAVGYGGLCDACRGTGKGGTTTRGLKRKQEFLDALFFIDAPRFALMDRDICPDCGGGGCGGECHWTDEEWEIYGQ
jgi:hypothetical protein